MVYKNCIQVLCGMAAIVISGCAEVEIYSDQSLTKQTGIPVYGSKPYLLVSRTGDKEGKPIVTEVLYIKDPTNVIYVKPKGGFGSNNLNMALTNGQLTNYGQTTDTKIPELITSISGLITARANAVKTEAEAASIRASLVGKSRLSGLIQVDTVRDVASDIDAKLSKKQLEQLSAVELEYVNDASKILHTALSQFENKQNPLQLISFFKQVQSAIDQLSRVAKPSSSTRTIRDSSLAINEQWMQTLKTYLSTALAENQALPDFELYEIIIKDGATELRQIIPATH